MRAAGRAVHGSFTALHLLWCGIGAFVARQRRYRHLFGALTILGDLGPEAARQLARALPRAPQKLSAYPSVTVES
ncbi:MAG TPA: hypothetical protein VF530_02650 [Planctomycetota bacterium]